MARITGELTFTGSLGNLSAYKMRGSDKIILRTKGGASKEKIKNDAAFENVRRNNFEFGGRSKGAAYIMRAFRPQKAVADYNISGYLNGFANTILKLDTESKYGQRNVLFSKNPKLLEGFSLNNNITFDSILRTSLAHSLSRDTFSARVDIPELLPGINFHAQQRFAMYSVVAVLGIVPDLFCKGEEGYKPSVYEYEAFRPKTVETDWYPVQSGSPATTLDLNLGITPPDQSFSLMLSIGIRYGAMHDATTVRQVKHAGAAKVLAMV